MQRIAIISGSSRGLGASMALNLAKQGIITVVTYQNSKKDALKVLDKLKPYSPESMVLKLNIKSRKSIKNVIEKTLEKFSKIDILVNNAGINQRCNFYDITDNDWDEIFDVNLRGAFIFTQECLKVMKKNSRIINISSVAGQYHGPTTVHYAVSKAALNSLTKATARYAAKKNIYVNAIAPGIIATDQTYEQFKSGAAKKIIDSTQLLKRPGELKDLNSAVNFLIDKNQTYMTGQIIALSGGAIIDN